MGAVGQGKYFGRKPDSGSVSRTEREYEDEFLIIVQGIQCKTREEKIGHGTGR